MHVETGDSSWRVSSAWLVWLLVAGSGLAAETPEAAGRRMIFAHYMVCFGGFKLFLSPDLAGLRDLPENIGDMVKRFAKHPNQFRHQDKQVLSGWGGSPASYAEAVNRLKKEGHDLCFVPHVYCDRWAMAWSFEKVARLFEGQPHLDGVFFFGVDDDVSGLLRTHATARTGWNSRRGTTTTRTRT